MPGAPEVPEPEVPEPALVEVGRIARPHGLRGEVVVELITDRDERMAPGARLHSDAGELVVASSRPQHGTHSQSGSGTGRQTRQRWVVLFEDHVTRDAADQLRGMTLRAEPIDDPDELWAHDLVGAEVVLHDSREAVGRCVAIVANPASDLLELDTGPLIPVVFVTGHSPGQIVVDPPEGLLDL
jgi:16S rRNA processing protein RimM